MKLIERLRHEPLLSFAIIGIGIFALNTWLQPAQQTTTDTISIDAERIESWKKQFRSGNGRLPQQQEVDAAVEQWVDEEVLYRQAMLHGLHQNDSIVRRQLIQKMNFVIEGATPLPPATDAQLQAFMESQPEKYQQPAKLSLQQVFLARGPSSLNQQAAQLLQQLQTAPESYKGKGDSFPLGQTILNADNTLLRKHFGKRFVDQVTELPADNNWLGPIESGLGMHLLRITKRTAAQPPELSSMREKVALDYRLQQEEIARRKTLDSLRKQYSIEIVSTPEAKLADAR